MSGAVRWVAIAPALLAATVTPGRAEVTECHVVDVKLTPAMQTSTPAERHEPSQIVAWVEKPTGEYVDTIFITQQTGRYGLGNRPGRFDFNSGPMWPYGRRVTTFPVWAHRKTPQSFPEVVFQNVEGYHEGCYTQCINAGGQPAPCQAQCAFPEECEPLINDAFTNCGDNNLSHPFDQSSVENHYCQPYQPSDPKWQQADAMTCATSAYTDKGKLSQSHASLYPPRSDLMRATPDAPSTEQYKLMNPFDAVSQATPPSGTPAKISWAIPQGLPVGSYVLWIEVAQAFDHNATYSTAAYPAPPAIGEKKIQWSTYGMPYRGQPSILYKVPFTIGSVTTTASTASYEGYGDPDGLDGVVRAPDPTITTTTPGSGASRLQLVSDGSTMYRVLVITRPEYDYALPGGTDSLQAIGIGSTTATLRFVAPGDDGLTGKVSGYEVRYLANREMTEDTFAAGAVAASANDVVDPGRLQAIELSGLLPETEYWVGVRAFDDCRNTGPISIVKLTTADRPVGEVDACFIATAAYGSVMANDVELLRHFRDSLMKRTVLGELAIETYYTFGPAVAGVVGESELLRASARSLLVPLVMLVKHFAY